LNLFYITLEFKLSKLIRGYRQQMEYLLLDHWSFKN